MTLNRVKLRHAVIFMKYLASVVSNISTENFNWSNSFFSISLEDASYHLKTLIFILARLRNPGLLSKEVCFQNIL